MSWLKDAYSSWGSELTRAFDSSKERPDQIRESEVRISGEDTVDEPGVHGDFNEVSKI